MVLHINACVRKNSRTLILATSLLSDAKGEIVQVKLDQMQLLPLNGERLQERDRLIAAEAYDHPFFALARQFAEADEIYISAPYWDLSFPSLLKIYMENVTVSGITFKYNNGTPIGLCKAKKLTYVTTAGGKIFADFGYEYIKTLAKGFYGISDVVCYRVENLDVNCIEGNQVLSQEIVMEN